MQGVFLLMAASGLFPYLATFAVTATALAALVWSFGRDILWLYRNRPSRVRRAPVAEVRELVAS